MSERKLIAKAFQTVYGPKEPIVPQVTARKASDTSFIIKLPSGASLEVSLGEQINDLMMDASGSDFLSGTLEAYEAGVLSLGGRSILVGDNIDTQSHAIKIRSQQGGDQYLIREGEGRKAASVRVHVGQNYKNYGATGIDQYGNISFSNNEKSIPVFQKQMERNLVVFDQPGKAGKGKEAYMNIVLPGEEGRDQVGQPGVFYERWGNRPAKFCVTPKDIYLDEFGLTNDKLDSFVVGVFFPSRSEGYTSCSFRSTEDALSERYTFLKIAEEKKRIGYESKLIGISEKDHPDARYLNYLQTQLEHYNKGCYQSAGWRITEGWSLFGAKEPKKEREPSPSP